MDSLRLWVWVWICAILLLQAADSAAELKHANTAKVEVRKGESTSRLPQGAALATLHLDNPASSKDSHCRHLDPIWQYY